MRTFAIELSSEQSTERIEEAVSFTGRDETGSFGILGAHEPFATILSWGLCSFRTTASPAHRYLAVPGGVLLFSQDVLRICARRIVRGGDPEQIVKHLTDETRVEEEQTRELHELLKDLDRELLRRLLSRRSP